jgi:hypothetical protein
VRNAGRLDRFTLPKVPFHSASPAAIKGFRVDDPAVRHAFLTVMAQSVSFSIATLRIWCPSLDRLLGTFSAEPRLSTITLRT